MSRSQFRHNVHDAEGKVIQNALCFVYLEGTTTPVSDLYLGEVGGSPVSSLTSDVRGDLVGYMDVAKRVDIKVTSNGGAAFYASHPSQRLSWTDFTETVEVLSSGGGGAIADLAGGDLTGSYPNPTIGASKIFNANVSATAAIDWTKTTLPSDPAAGTPGARTLGTGAQQAAAGNDSRFSTVGAQPGDTYWTKPKLTNRWYSIPYGHINYESAAVSAETAVKAGAGAAETATPGTTNVLMGSQVTYWIPMILPAGTLDRLYIEIVTVGSAGSILLGIYADSNWAPSGSGPLVQGSIDRATLPASASAASAVVSLVLTGGVYWFAVLDPQASGPAVIRGQQGGISVPVADTGSHGGYPSATGGGISQVGFFSFTQTTLGAVPAMAGPLGGAGLLPRPWVRYSA